jgi:glutathione S-transferase
VLPAIIHLLDLQRASIGHLKPASKDVGREAHPTGREKIPHRRALTRILSPASAVLGGILHPPRGTTMILHTVPGSPNSRKVQAVISHLDLDVEIRPREIFKGELRSAEYLALNPNAKVPTLVDGDFKLWESTAIMQYLADEAGDNELFPRNSRTRADITRWQCWEGAHFNAALGTLTWETVVKAKRNLGPPDAALVDQARASLSRYAPVLNGYMDGRKFLVNDRLTLADYSVAALEPYLNLVPFDFTPHRHIHQYFDRIRQSEHWIRAGKSTAAQPIAA